MLSIGLMSGTSMDGIDAALLRTDGDTQIEELGHTSMTYDPLFKIALHAAQYCIKACKGDMAQAGENYALFGIEKYLRDELKMSDLNVAEKLQQLINYFSQTAHPHPPITLDDVIQHSTQLHAEAVRQLLASTQYQREDIDVVGYHGQAMYHQPDQGISIIVGDGQALADLVGITVVNDFRSRDIAAGGQGAPFAPVYHQALAIRDNKIPAAVVNCGGIANITVMSDSHLENLIGFDTGPGNGLIDQLVRQRTAGKENIDQDGRYGKQGRVHEGVLAALYRKSIIKNGGNYYEQTPPKSLDFGDLHLIDELDALSLEDACATLEAFTADTIVSSLALFDLAKGAVLPKTWILAGGGWNNPVIRRELEQRLQQKLGDNIAVMTANEAGWNSQALEAQIFAYFAVRSLQGKPLSVPGTTGVPMPLSGGQVYPPGGI